MADRIAILEKKLEATQAQIAEMQAELKLLKRDVGNPKSSTRSVPAPTPVTKAPSVWSKKKSQEWELLFGGNILGKAGILSIVIALSWFVKYAFDNHWVNESGKIFSGLLISSLMGFFGLRLAMKKFQALPLALLGGAIAGFLITIFTAYYVYDLLGRSEAFLYLVVVLLWGFFLSHRAKSQSLFAFSLMGAFGLPIAFSQGENSYRFLFSYLLLVNMGYHFINGKFHWRISSAVMALLNIASWLAWFITNVHQSSFLLPFFYLSSISVAYLFSENPLSAFKQGDFPWVSSVLFPLFFIFYGVYGYAIVQIHYPDYAPHFLVALTVLPVLQFRFGPEVQSGFFPGSLLFIVFKISALMMLLAFFTGNDLTLAFVASLGFYLYLFVTRRFTLSYITSAALVLLLVTRLYFFDFDSELRPFLNYRFLIFVLSVGLFGWTHLRMRDFGPAWYWKIPGFLAVATLIIGTCTQVDLIVADTHYRNLGYSYVLAFYTAIFLMRGFMRENRFLRQIGFSLAVLLVLKLYLYDIWTLSLIVRIIAGLSLGAGLVVLSLMYQKFREQLMKSFGKTPVLIFVFSALLAGGSLRAEGIKGYQYVKKIQAVPVAKPEGKKVPVFGRLSIDDEVYRHSGEHDIRLKFRNRLLPYLVQTEVTAGKSMVTKHPVVTYSDTSELIQTYVLRMPPIPEGYVYTSLKLGRGDTFESNVRISAIDNNEANLDIGEQKLFRYQDEENLKINLDIADVKSLRLEVSPPGHFDVLSAVASARSRDAEIQLAVDVASLKTDVNKDTRYSVVYFNNPDRRKLSRVRLKFKEPRFRRTVKVYEQTPDSHRYHLADHRVITKGISEKETSPWVEFAFNANRARKLKIEIAYGDDLPLTLVAFETWALTEHVVFEIPSEMSSKDEILLYYGNAYARVPSHDLGSRYKTEYPVTEFTAAKEEKNPDFGYSLVEPPLSVWVIRMTFGALLAALVLAAWKILGRYTESLAASGTSPAKP